MGSIEMLIAYIRRTIGISGFAIASFFTGLLLPFAIIVAGYCIEILGQTTFLHYFGTLGKTIIAIGSFIKGIIFSNIFLAPFKATFFGAVAILTFILLNFAFMEERVDSKLLDKMYDEYILAKLKQNEELAKNLSKKIAHMQVKYMKYLS